MKLHVEDPDETDMLAVEFGLSQVIVNIKKSRFWAGVLGLLRKLGVIAYDPVNRQPDESLERGAPGEGHAPWLSAAPAGRFLEEACGALRLATIMNPVRRQASWRLGCNIAMLRRNWVHAVSWRQMAMPACLHVGGMQHTQEYRHGDDENTCKTLQQSG